MRRILSFSRISFYLVLPLDIGFTADCFCAYTALDSLQQEISVSSFGWKPIPSEARVTRDEVSGFIEHIVTAVWKTVPPNERSIRVNPINPCYKKLSGETSTDCICAYTGLDSLQQEIIRDNHCAQQAPTNPARHNKNP